MEAVQQLSEIRAETSRPAGLRRYVALDAYRGLIMVLLISGGFGLPALKHDPAWHRIAGWFDHVPWEGAVLWDMIQPAFMFMVGVAMPFAFAKRVSDGATRADNIRHVVVRCIRLVILSQIIIWVGRGRVTPQLINVLSQIAFTYFLSYFIMQWKWRYQVIAAAGILAFWTALLFAFPGPDGPFSRTGSVGLVVDRAIFHYDYDPAYSTLNFIPSTVWTLAGVWAGRLLMTGRSQAATLRTLAGGMALSFALWLALRSWIPMIKQLCTPTFIFYSLGWVLAMLIGFYWFVEMRGHKSAVFPLVVVGMNSIFIYSVAELLHHWLDRAVGVFTFRFEFLGATGHIAQACAVVLVLWYLCYWLYQRRIFIKL